MEKRIQKLAAFSQKVAVVMQAAPAVHGPLCELGQRVTLSISAILP